jgi:cullin 3
MKSLNTNCINSKCPYSIKKVCSWFLILDQLDVERKEVLPKVEDDRRHIIEATIVRVMKARKKMEHNDLISEVMKILSAIFQPTAIMIKQKIEGLIEKDYMMRDPEDRRKYIYKA